MEVRSSWLSRAHLPGLFCMLISALMLAFTGFTVGLMLYHEYVKPTAARRYQGYCTVPIPNDMRETQNSHVEPNYKVLPLRWSSEPDVQVINTGDDDAGESFVNALREELDIEDTVEKISVVNNGHRVNFIHDFTDNTSGIIDNERCFVMDLEPELVLSPGVFITGLEHGDEFDVSRVRSTLKAAIPALHEFSHGASDLYTRCFPRPLYRLYTSEDGVIRKRSIDDPEHDYIHFAGKHVQEIKIDNMAEVLEHEKKTKN